MAQSIDSVSCGNDYTNAATLQDIYAASLHVPHSNGGNFTVTGNDAWVQLQWYTANGQSAWTPEFHAAVGPAALSPGTTGVRFRNYVAGQVAVVSAGLFYPAQPIFTITGAGTVAVATTTVVTGIVDATGGVTAGKNFTVNHSGTGVYAVTFTAGIFAAAPVVLPSTTNAGENADRAVLSSQPTASTFTVSTFSNAGSAADRAFNFLAYTVQ